MCIPPADAEPHPDEKRARDTLLQLTRIEMTVSNEKLSGRHRAMSVVILFGSGAAVLLRVIATFFVAQLPPAVGRQIDGQRRAAIGFGRLAAHGLRDTRATAAGARALRHGDWRTPPQPLARGCG